MSKKNRCFKLYLCNNSLLPHVAPDSRCGANNVLDTVDVIREVSIDGDEKAATSQNRNIEVMQRKELVKNNI